MAFSIGGGGGGFGGITSAGSDFFSDKLSNWTGSDKRKAEKNAKEAMEDAIKAYGRLETPEFEDYDPELYKWLEDYNPEMLDAGKDVKYEGVDPRLADIANVGRSEMDDISVDPRLKEDQLASLAALEDIANSGGFNTQDRAALNSIQSEVAQADKGRRDAIMQNMAQRGQGGSGMELLAMLDSAQAATDRANQSGLDIAGMAQKRAMDAILAGGSMAGDIRGQDFSEQAKIAEANDIISKFNAQNYQQGNQFNANAMNQANQFNANNQLANDQYNRNTNIDAGKFNVNNQNQAQLFNIGGKQDTANANTGLKNQAQIQNKFTNPQQQFTNEYNKATGMANAYQGLGNQQMNQANAERQDMQQERENVKTIVSSVMGGMASDERVKTDVKPVNDDEIGEFVSAIQPKKFKYKNPEQPGQSDGNKVGFMLQDVEDTSLGKDLVKTDVDGVKKYDQQNFNGIIMAILQSLTGKAA